MEYEIRLFDAPLLRFEADPQSVDGAVEITWVDKEKQGLLPTGMDVSNEGVSSWIRHRAIPKNRAFVSTFLAKSGLSVNRPLGIITVCKGLSLNDCYWVVPSASSDAFAKVNLYENPMSRLLAEIAFTGYGSSVRASFGSSPEFTTNGMLPKCWRRINKKIYLYKGGTSGFANTGFEPYSEYYAADIADTIGIEHVDYQLHTWKGILCSSCELFSSKELSFVSAANLVKSGGFAAVIEFYKTLDARYQQAFSDMIAFDALICNTDRHMNNFGFMFDAETNEMVGPAPLFDHGNSLFHQAFGDDWSSLEALEAYAAAQAPCMYVDFFEAAGQIMTHETRSKVRKALNFSFSRKPIKGFSPQRLGLLEEMVRARAAKLLE